MYQYCQTLDTPSIQCREFIQFLAFYKASQVRFDNNLELMQRVQQEVIHRDKDKDYFTNKKQLFYISVPRSCN